MSRATFISPEKFQRIPFDQLTLGRNCVFYMFNPFFAGHTPDNLPDFIVIIRSQPEIDYEKRLENVFGKQGVFTISQCMEARATDSKSERMYLEVYAIFTSLATSEVGHKLDTEVLN